MTAQTYIRFTDRARKVMQMANQAAQRLNHDYISSEHILLGISREGTWIAAVPSIGAIADEVIRLVQPGTEMVTMGKLPHSQNAKKVIEYAIESSQILNHNWVGVEHLLLGLLRLEDGIVFKAISNLRLSQSIMRDQILACCGAVESNGDKPTVETADQNQNPIMLSSVPKIVAAVESLKVLSEAYKVSVTAAKPHADLILEMIKRLADAIAEQIEQQ